VPQRGRLLTPPGTPADPYLDPAYGPLPRRGRVVWAGIAPGCRDHRQQAARQSHDHSKGALGADRIAGWYCARLRRRSEPGSARCDRPGRRDTPIARLEPRSRWL